MRAIVPIRSFASGMTRLESALPKPTRIALSRAIATRVVAAAQFAGMPPTVVSSADDVVEWCRSEAVTRIDDPGGGLDDAVAAAVTTDPWCVIHADLALLTPDDLHLVIDRAARGPVIAPAQDGGTNLIAARGAFPFRYGPGSFARHLTAAGAGSSVLVRPGLAVEIDTVDDLDAAARVPAGAWLQRFLS